MSNVMTGMVVDVYKLPDDWNIKKRISELQKDILEKGEVSYRGEIISIINNYCSNLGYIAIVKSEEGFFRHENLGYLKFVYQK